MQNRILLVEDEELIGEMVKLNLEQEGYTVTWFSDGSPVPEFLKTNHVDLIILDVMMPGKTGFEIARDIRTEEIGTPILMLTARSETDAKVEGFGAGADDYLTKPFELVELFLRVGALIRRSQGFTELHSSMLAQFAGFDVNLESREAETREGKILLSEKEANLISLFLRSPGRTLSRADILEEVWGMDTAPTERTVDNFIVRLRRMFEENPDDPKYIHTVRNRGYRYQPEEQEPEL